MANVNCNACSGVFAPEIKTERRGELEYQYFCCPFCDKPYLISVTDEGLRESIQDYLAIGEQIRREGSTWELVDRSTELLHQNTRRSQELAAMYPIGVDYGD